MNALDGLGIDGARAAEDGRRAKEDEVGQASFLRLLVAQLENQDPLNPQDSAAFASQLAQFSSVEQLVAVRAGIDELVAAGAKTTDGAGAHDANSIDATNLVGREVVVFGSQIEVDAARNPVVMPIRTVETALSAKVRIYDENGTLRYESSILPTDDAGQPIALRAGDHEFVFDPREHNLPEGTYAIEFSAEGVSGGQVTVLPTVTGIVTGAILSSEPKIRVGNRIFSVADVLEVRLPSGAAGSVGSQGGVATGGSQATFVPPAPTAAPGSASFEIGGGQVVRRPPTTFAPAHFTAGS